jgi:hypothetical protein
MSLILGGLGVHLMIRTQQNFEGILVRFASLFLAYFIVVLFHEIGHVLFGTLSGLKFSWLSVGKIQLYLNTRHRLRLRFIKHLNLLSGFASMYTNVEHFLRWRWMIFILGGVLGNIFLFLLAKFTDAYVSRGSFLSNTIIFAGLLSIITSAFSLIPYRTKGFASDGFQLLHFLRGGTQMRRIMAITLLHGSAREGAGSGEWNTKWIEDALVIKDNSVIEAMANLYAHEWALNKRDNVTAELHLDRALKLVEKLDPAMTTALYWAQAYFLAIHKHDAVGARAAFEKAGSNPLALAYYPLRSEAAVLFAEGHFEEAKAKAQEGIKVYKKLGSPKYGQEELEQLEDILAKAENSLALSSSMVA